MRHWVTIYENNGKCRGFHKVEEYDAQEFANTGTELVSAPFKEGATFYPIDLMASVLQDIGQDYFGKDFEIEEFAENFMNWKPI